MYYTLLVRTSVNEPWCIEFGAIDLSDVVAEREEYSESGMATRILQTLTMSQLEINNQVERINHVYKKKLSN